MNWVLRILKDAIVKFTYYNVEAERVACLHYDAIW